MQCTRAAQEKLYEAIATLDKFCLPKFEEEIGARNVEIRPACTHTPSITEGSRAASGVALRTTSLYNAAL